MKKLLIVCCLLGAATVALFAQQPRGILFQNATLIDGNAATPMATGDVLIRDGKIEKIDWKNKISPAATDSVIDCTGKFITPGLWDAHIHNGTYSMYDQEQVHKDTNGRLENMLRHGITSLRDMAGDAVFLAEYKRKALLGYPFPDIFYAAQFAGPPYFEMYNRGSTNAKHSLLPAPGSAPWELAVTESTPLTEAIAAAKGAGVTGIKVYADLSPELVAAITKEAHRQGLKVWSHAMVFPARPMDNVKAGVNSLSHANDFIFQQLPEDKPDISKAWEWVYKGAKADKKIQEPLLKAMKEKDIFIDPTLYHAGNNNMTNAFTIARWAHELGVKFVAGTDWIYPETNSDVPLENELKALIEKAGLTPREAIEAATWNAAQVTGALDRGLLKEGMLADLLILDSNPVEDIATLFKPILVFKRGSVWRW